MSDIQILEKRIVLLERRLAVLEAFLPLLAHLEDAEGF